MRGVASGMSVISASVVRIMPAIDGRVLHRRAGHLGRVDDALGHHVAILVGQHVVADAGVLLLRAPCGAPPRPRPSHPGRRWSRSGASALRARGAGCSRRSRRRPSACRPSSAGSAFSSATPPPGDDALFHRGAGGAQGVLDAVLLLLQLGLGRGADLDHRHAAGQLRQALLQLLLVVVAGGLRRSAP